MPGLDEVIKARAEEGEGASKRRKDTWKSSERG